MTKMADAQSYSGNRALYRFTEPDGTEVEQRQLSGDEAAEDHARDLSRARQAPIIIQRHDHVDWEYVTEADERP